MGTVSSPPQAILFDLDGTLYDFRPLLFPMLFQKPADLRRLYALFQARKTKAGINYGSRAALLDALALDISLRLPGQDAHEILRWYVEILYGRFVSILNKYAHCRSELRSLLTKWACTNRGDSYSGPLIGVLSDYGYVEDRLGAIGLAARDFDLILSSEDMGALKPAPEPYLAAAEHFGVSPSEILVVGDQLDTDRRGAVAAGMGFFHLTSSRDARLFAETFMKGLV